MPDFLDVVRAQRACRSFRPDPVPDDLVERVLQAATFAPSAENRQPWVFVVVRDDDRRSRLGELVRRAWRGGGKGHSSGRLPPGLFADVERGAEGGLAAAPVHVIVGGDTRVGIEAVMPASIYPAVQNLLLAATALGLGSALTTLPIVFADELRALVGLPEHVLVMAVVPLGWPARHLGPPRRAPVTDRAHRERYGVAW